MHCRAKEEIEETGVRVNYKNRQENRPLTMIVTMSVKTMATWKIKTDNSWMYGLSSSNFKQSETNQNRSLIIYYFSINISYYRRRDKVCYLSASYLYVQCFLVFPKILNWNISGITFIWGFQVVTTPVCFPTKKILWRQFGNLYT